MHTSKAITVTMAGPPAQPEIIAQQGDPNGGVLLTRGTPPAEVTWYWQGTNASGTSTADDALTYNVANSGTYYLRARQNAANCWSTTDEITVNITSQTPTGFSTVAQGADAIALSWAGAGNETGFYIKRAASASGPFTGLYLADGSETSYVDKNLSAGTRYYYIIQAVVDDQYSAPTAPQNSQTSDITTTNNDLTYKPQYNGNIAGVKWNTGEQEKLYTYHYDPLNRITAANYAEQSAPDIWDRGVGDYQVFDIGYDLNGNIGSLSRQQHDFNAEVMDALTYHYEGNRLQYVEDAAIIAGGFADRHSGSDDYAYDANGNMTKDLNKDIVTITYNHLNLPQTVTKADGHSIQYVYDAAGVKLAQLVYDAEDNLLKKTDYMGGFIYEQEGEAGTPELQLIQHEEGRIVRNELDDNWEYQYFLRDHLGNNRVVFTTRPKTHEFTLNYESDTNLPDDEALFEELNNIIPANIHDHTDAGSTYDKSQLLNGANGGVIGSVVTIPVGAGDKVSAEVWAKYLAPTGTSNPTAAVGSLLIAALTGNTGTLNYEGSINSSYGTSGSMATGVFGDEVSSTEPMAFINLLFLPDDVAGTIENSHFAFSQISSASSNSHAILALDEPYEAPAAGYIVVYLSNESTNLTEVYFDDLKVTVNEHPVIQTNSYYPFGLEHAGGFNRVTSPKNRYLYNGKEEQQETGWLDYGARMYMPDIGRFFTQDRFATKYFSLSPYQYAANNPIKNIDVNGDSINVSNLITQNGKLSAEGLYTLFNMVSDLSDITGQNFSVNGSGNLVSDGKINKDKNGNQIGSKSARKYVNGLIGSTRDIKVTNDNSKSTQGGGIGSVNINSDQIDNNIASMQSAGLGELTFGYGMSFLHESMHTATGTFVMNPSATTAIGDPSPTTPNAQGPTVTNVNVFRNELGLPERSHYFWQQTSTTAPKTMRWNQGGKTTTVTQGTMTPAVKQQRRGIINAILNFRLP